MRRESEGAVPTVLLWRCASLLGKPIAASLFYLASGEMSVAAQTGRAKPPEHGEIGCEISARVTDKRNWVLCRACLNTQHSQTKKVEAKPLPAIFNPSLFLINPKLAKTSAFDSMTDEFAIVNVKRNGLLHLISPYFSL